MKTKILFPIIILGMLLFANCTSDHAVEEMPVVPAKYILCQVVSMDDGDTWDMKQCDPDCNVAHWKNKLHGKHYYALAVVYDLQDGTGQHMVSGNYVIDGGEN